MARPVFQKEVAPEAVETAPREPVAEPQPEVVEVTLPSEALTDTAPVLTGVKVTVPRPHRGARAVCATETPPSVSPSSGLAVLPSRRRR